MNKYDELFGPVRIEKVNASSSLSHENKAVLDTIHKVGKALSGTNISVCHSVLINVTAASFRQIKDLEFRRFVAKGFLQAVIEVIKEVTQEESKNDNPKDPG